MHVIRSIKYVEHDINVFMQVFESKIRELAKIDYNEHMVEVLPVIFTQSHKFNWKVGEMIGGFPMHSSTWRMHSNRIPG